MQTKVNVKLHMRSGEIIECCYASRMKSYAGALREMFNTQSVQAFIRKGTTKAGALFVMMREVLAVEIYDI